MKKIIIISLSILTIASVFFGCKRGPEDPFLSFRSRKARVSGVWNVTAYTINGIDSLNRVSAATSVDSSSCGAAYKLTTTVGYTYVWTFDKTGAYDIQINSSTTLTRTFPTGNGVKCKSFSTTSAATAPFEEKGIWDFAGGVGQFKTKEEIILTDPTDHVNDITFDMIKCSYKQLILSQSVTDHATGLVTIYQWTMSRQK